MIKLLELIKKNFKLLVRAKVSALVIFIGPLLIVSLLGIAYSHSNNFALTTSVYSSGYSEISESLITKMTNQNFGISRQSSIQRCIGSVKLGESQACIIFPPDMTTESDKTTEITFYVDYSQINLVWIMLDVRSAKVSEQSEEISEKLTGDILNRLWFIEDKIKSGRSTVSAIMSDGDSIKESGTGIQTGFKKLDISVDFSGLDVVNTRNSTQSVKDILSGLKNQAANLSSSAQKDIKSIESSAAAIESQINDSSIMSEVDDIDDAADEVQEVIENIVEKIDEDVSNASAKIDLILLSLESIEQRMSDTQSKISTVKKERDGLMPQFESISTSINNINTNINKLQGVLDEAQQKILAVKGKSAESIAAPITTKIEPISTQKTHFNSLFPTLLVLIIMITGILLSSTLIIVDKKSKAFLRNNFTPTSYFTFNLSTYLTALIVLLIQLLLFVSVSVFFFETEVLASILPILITILLTCTVFICTGMFIGFIFRTEETVTLASITLATVFLFFSSAVIPLESLPGYMKDIALFNPFVMSEFAFRQTLIFQLGFTEILGSLGILAGCAIGLFALLILTQNALRKLSFMHFNKTYFNNTFTKKKKSNIKSLNSKLSKKKDVKDINELAVKK